jgi:DNA primase large subunit
MYVVYICRIPFTEALQLVQMRSVYLQGGFAYVPLKHVLNVIVTRFRMNLSRSLSLATHFFDTVSADNRIGSLLKVCFIFIMFIMQIIF